MRNLWRDHSLTIVGFGIGTALLLAAIPFREGTTFDILSGVGGGVLGTAVIFALSGPLREKNKPEEHPENDNGA